MVQGRVRGPKAVEWLVARVLVLSSFGQDAVFSMRYQVEWAIGSVLSRVVTNGVLQEK